MILWIYLRFGDFAHLSGVGDFDDDVYWSYDMYILEVYDFYPLRLLRNFIYAYCLNFDV